MTIKAELISSSEEFRDAEKYGLPGLGSDIVCESGSYRAAFVQGFKLVMLDFGHEQGNGKKSAGLIEVRSVLNAPEVVLNIEGDVEILGSTDESVYTALNPEGTATIFLNGNSEVHEIQLTHTH